MVKRFSSDHVWIETLDEVARVGITVHAQDALGDIVFVEMPEVGRVFSKGDALAVVESVKAAADVLSPVSLSITQVNDSLKSDPSLANSDPLNAGWLVEAQLKNPEELEALMDLTTYTAFCAA